MGCNCCYTPKLISESRETVHLREEFARQKRRLAALSSADFTTANLRKVEEFTKGRKDPPVNIPAEGQTQLLLRKGIEEMEELLESRRVKRRVKQGILRPSLA